MTDVPGGPWSAVLIGHQWPAFPALAALSSAATNRGTISDAFEAYSERIRAAATGILAAQQGVTAHTVQEAFHSGAEHARGVAERNAAKREALQQAHRLISELRSTLTEIADSGSRQIGAILDADESNRVKIAQIADVAAAAQSHANSHAARCLDEIYEQIQRVLHAGGSDRSAREFGRGMGIDAPAVNFSPDLEMIRTQVDRLVAEPDHD